jgi:hypothetical protein
MAWGIMMAFPMVLGMLMLAFAEPETEYQTFGQTVLNPPTAMKADTEEQELRKAA